MGYSEYTENSIPYAAGSFDLLSTNGGIWQWRWNNGATPVTAMDLTSDGIARILAPEAGEIVNWMQLDPNGKVIFGFTDAANETPTAVGTLSFNHSNNILSFNNSRVLTESYADTRYLKTGVNRLQFGLESTAQSDYSIALGKNVLANGLGAVALGAAINEPAINPPRVWALRAIGKGATAVGYGAWAQADGATAMGWASEVYARGGVAIGETNVVYSQGAGGVALGFDNQIEAAYGVGLGGNNRVRGNYSTGLGHFNTLKSTAQFSLAAGYTNTVEGLSGVALGALNAAKGPYSAAIGFQNVTEGSGALAVGVSNVANGQSAVALGGYTDANGEAAFAAGWYSFASASYATALGYYTEASGQASTAIGYGTRAIGPKQLVVGSYNEPVVDPDNLPGGLNDAAFIVGNGTAPTARSNAFVVRWNGNIEAAGNVKAAGAVQASQAGGLTVPATIKAVNGTVLVPKSGDVGMGDFSLGEQP